MSQKKNVCVGVCGGGGGSVRACVCTLLLRARKQISLHRDNKVVLYCIAQTSNKTLIAGCMLIMCNRVMCASVAVNTLLSFMCYRVYCIHVPAHTF